MDNKPLVSINILSYNSLPYIEGCLDTVLAQTYRNIEILVIITGSDDGSGELVKEKYGRHKKIRIIDPRRNLWFSKGHNFALKNTTGEYVLVLNQDTVLDKNFVSKLIDVLEADSSLGSVSGKLLHYNFSIGSKTKILDSTGIEIFKTRRLIDRGQWEQDFHQYDTDTEIFGPSGAAAIYRRSALEDVKIPKRDGQDEYFDEDFIAYKEDADLAWRLQLAGYQCRYVPDAIIYHGRTVGRSWPTQFIRFILNRHRQPRLLRKMSFKNHYLMMVKNEIPVLFRRHFLYILIREFLLVGYSAIFEPFQIFTLAQFFRQLPEALRKRKIIMAKVKADPAKLRTLFH